MGLNWQPLRALREQWQTNLNSLRDRDANLAEWVRQHQPVVDYVFASEPHHLHLGCKTGEQIQELSNPVPPGSARDVARKLFPTGQCTEPVLVGGLDQGWLWETLHQLPCNTPATPGHRPPLYLLANDLERFWLVLHLHDWSKFLTDQRNLLFVGPDAVAQCQSSMIENVHVPWAKLSVTIDQSIWPTGMSIESLLQTAHQSASARMQQVTWQIEAMYAGFDVKSNIRKLHGEPLRIVGFTSYFTTFLKYSMRDWLDALAQLGHKTLLVMEQADHQVNNPLHFAEQVIAFKPDLIVMIDHYRAEMPGLPRDIPCVMWVQDNLPNIFNSKAGTSQGRRDYCLGFGRLQLRDAYGYPQDRFMPAQVAVNETRFAPRTLSQSDLDACGCDISFVSHASVPATVLLTEQINRADASGKKVLIDIFEQMRGVYDASNAITQPLIIVKMIDSTLSRLRLRLDEPSTRGLRDFFITRVNNALFRHQSLTWAAELGVKLNLWGRGWEKHPRFAKFAKGIACNESQLATIYQASKINLQLTPTGAVHQRLFEGLASGGFFLLRHCPGDEIELRYRELRGLCEQFYLVNDEQLRRCDEPRVVQLLEQLATLIGVNPFENGYNIIDAMHLSADGDYIRSAAAVWDEYDQVAFRSSAQLRKLATHFLADETERKQIADSMRRVVLNRFSYRSTSQRLLEFIADDLEKNTLREGVAA
jgi:hypothetical protein